MFETCIIKSIYLLNFLSQVTGVGTGIREVGIKRNFLTNSPLQRSIYDTISTVHLKAFIERLYCSIFGKGHRVLYVRLYTAAEIYIKKAFC